MRRKTKKIKVTNSKPKNIKKILLTTVLIILVAVLTLRLQNPTGRPTFDASQMVPLCEYGNNANPTFDFFYQKGLVDGSCPSSGHKYKGIKGWVFDTPQTDTLSLCEYYQSYIATHSYKLASTEGVCSPDWSYFGHIFKYTSKEGNIFTNQQPGTVPLCRYMKLRYNDRCLPKDRVQRRFSLGAEDGSCPDASTLGTETCHGDKNKYRYEDIVGWVFPSKTTAETVGTGACTTHEDCYPATSDLVCDLDDTSADYETCISCTEEYQYDLDDDLTTEDDRYYCDDSQEMQDVKAVDDACTEHYECIDRLCGAVSGTCADYCDLLELLCTMIDDTHALCTDLTDCAGA